MTWPKIVLLAYFALVLLMNISMVGKDLGTKTAKGAVWSTVILAIVATLVVIA